MDKISDKVISRLTQYHCILVDCIKQNIHFTTSLNMAQLLRIDDSQVRKDISFLDNTGKSRVGYDVFKLKQAIEKALGFSKPKYAIIIGAGNLGSALAKYNDFESYGLSVLALFDIDKNKIGNSVNSKPIFDINELPNFVKKTNIDICILTVPSDYAQEVTKFVVGANIKYIWNFSLAVLKTPNWVEVWNENLMGNFLQFSYKIFG